MKPSRTLFILVVVFALTMLNACLPAPGAGLQEGVAPAGEKVKLTVLTHWGEESLLKPMRAKLDEYTSLNPHVEIDYQTVTFDQLLTKITTARAAGISPDVYHFYNLWMPDFVEGGMLDEPPSAVLADIQANYSPGSQSAVSYGGKIWGYPTELNTYQLLYNKKMLQEAGIEAPPATFAELKDAACKLAIANPDGTLARSGFVLMPGWDSGVVHPFLSLLWSNGGEYLAPETYQPLFNGPQGQATLQLYVDLIGEKCADPSIGAFGNFVEGKGAMLIMANWLRATLKDAFVDGYENVGVAPIPTGEGGVSTTLQYNWLYGVDSGSKNKEEAWKLVQWLNSPAGEGAASPIGDYLTSALGAIPSRISDQQALADRLSDEFMTAYVRSAANARAEPVLRGGQEIKTALQQGIEAAWYGQKTVEQALNDAAAEAERILAENR
ncbi:ABC transporter substrate-binding protein [Caldilinea sp.]|uniref:ABC transporter substrate-binding protein n=1 Tax=Caldilinea sp. TaxID=2293560 RepID=UPI0021DED412|nr:ABC transporter substrate-binding protein [Caldilinea sp.]GIV68636.1 MAG: bicyclomycin resistance protein [Caldilinea sp.]